MGQVTSYFGGSGPDVTHDVDGPVVFVLSSVAAGEAGEAGEGISNL